MPSWTVDQQAAIQADNHTLLISAAAGSGKTAVLVERILRLVRRNGAHLNRMLIVTFTRAAAGEMRDRLKRRLSEALLNADREETALLRQALDELASTDIATIDAFCRKAVREQFQLVNVDPRVGVIDEQEADRLFAQAFRQASETLLQQGGDEDYSTFVDAFSYDERLELSRRLYSFLMSLPRPEAWLERQLQVISGTPADRHPWTDVLMEKALMELQRAKELFRRQQLLLLREDAVPEFEELLAMDREAMEPVFRCCALLDFDGLKQALPQVRFSRAPSIRGQDEAQKAWKEDYNRIRKEIKELVSGYTALLTDGQEKHQRDIDCVSRLLRGLSRQVWATRDAFTALKTRQNSLDFSDMGQLTLRILADPNCRASLQAQYDHIFVDECQDVSRVQDAIFNSLHCEENSLFLVGDIKQSIYRFRLAEPGLFLDRIDRYSKAEDARERKIVLKQNFRSQWPVLDAVNRVFSRAMRRGVTEIDYTEDDELVAGLAADSDAPVELRLCRFNRKPTVAEALAAEAHEAAGIIRGLLTQQLTDRDSVRRYYRYSDICILMARTASQGEALTKLLEAEGIPVFFDGKGEYYRLPEVRSMKALLEAVDNPLQDVPLLASLKLPVFGFDEHQLSAVRHSRQGKDMPFYEAFLACCGEEGPLAQRCREARERLTEWRFLRDSMHLSDFLWQLMRDTGFFAQAGALPAGKARQANLRLLVEKAVDYEASGKRGLRGFIDRLNVEMSSGDNSTTAKLLGEDDNVVRVMTMHKSKGLEFPAVLLMRLSSAMGVEKPELMNLHEQLGLCLPYVNRELSIRRDSYGQEAFRYRQRQDQLAERCRLLYVAMTRARQRLFLTGCAEEGSMTPGSWLMPEGDLRVWEAHSMMDWVLQAVFDDLGLDALPEEGTVEGAPWRLSVVPVEEVKAAEAAPNRAEALESWLSAAKAPAAGEAPLWPAAAPDSDRRVLKTSVTALSDQELFREPLALSQQEETEEDKREPVYITQPLRLGGVPEVPAFLQEKRMSAAQRGTLMHRLLCLAPLERLRGLDIAAMAEELCRCADALSAQGCFTAEERAAIRPEQAAAFFSSALGQRMLASGTVRREWRFNLQLEGGTLLQGVIDSAWLEEDGWVICDYKTDYIEREEDFVHRHTTQLRWYARALSVISGQPVKECWLYSISLRKAMEVA